MPRAATCTSTSRARGTLLRPGEQFTIRPDTLHWFQAGEDGAIVSEFSTPSRDELDVFSRSADRSKTPSASCSSTSPGRPLTPTAPTRLAFLETATPPRKNVKNGSSSPARQGRPAPSRRARGWTARRCARPCRPSAARSAACRGRRRPSSPRTRARRARRRRTPTRGRSRWRRRRRRSDVRVRASFGDPMSANRARRTSMSEWPGSIAAVTLFVEDLGEAKSFYGARLRPARPLGGRQLRRVPVRRDDDQPPAGGRGAVADCAGRRWQRRRRRPLPVHVGRR